MTATVIVVLFFTWLAIGAAVALVVGKAADDGHDDDECVLCDGPCKVGRE